MIEIELINVPTGAQAIINYIGLNHSNFLYDVTTDPEDPTTVTEIWVNSRVKVVPGTSNSIMVYGYDENGEQVYSQSGNVPSGGFKYYIKTNQSICFSIQDLGGNVQGILIDKSRDSNNVERNEFCILTSGSNYLNWYECWGYMQYSIVTTSSALLMQLVPICSTKSTAYLVNTYHKYQGNSSYGKAIFDDRSYYVFTNKIAIQET